MRTHPKGAQARVLLTSVFGPYAQDDEYGSRSINPMELYHNQVTRAQGAFSLRLFHRSWGLMMIQANIPAPTTVLDFPNRDLFVKELRENSYDVVGITSIIVNVGKVREMCRLIREHSPQSTIVVGGHVTAIPGIEQAIDADHVVRGEGIAWMRRFLGVNDQAPIVHPPIRSGFGHRVMGLKLPFAMGSTAATIVPSVGCPMGCNFCTTSAFFGGKGKVTNFYHSGAELYRVMCDAEAKLGVSSFFLMDENFLLNKSRAMELLGYLKRDGKAWDFNVFSSAHAIRKYTMQELVDLGISWVWIGLESASSGYSKLAGADTVALTREMREHGIRVLGSTIIGMEHHTPENIRAEIEFAAEHDTDFHQFMLYTPVPGTPLYREMEAQGRLLDGDLADIHGQYKFNFRHPHISRDQSKEFLDYAFERDFARNGPSLYRVVRTTLAGFKRYRHHPDPRVRARFRRDGVALTWSFSGLLWAAERHVRASNPEAAEAIRALRAEIRREVGPACRAGEWTIGPVLRATARREERRLAQGIVYEPEPVIERTNWTTPVADVVNPLTSIEQAQGASTG
ncbi:MAG: cobalamin-dependent protein [Bryobacterales bacterium]|nr:cobalamin-dependent protein [Bryobacterales bacterium]